MGSLQRRGAEGRRGRVVNLVEHLAGWWATTGFQGMRGVGL